MTKNTKTEAIIVRVAPDLKATLQKLADADQRKLSDYVRLQLLKLVTNPPKS